jgi:hypothetical protein
VKDHNIAIFKFITYNLKESVDRHGIAGSINSILLGHCNVNMDHFTSLAKIKQDTLRVQEKGGKERWQELISLI